MNKKKAIKIATASAIAASTFAATAPFQTEAAVNVSATVTNAANVMKAAQDFTTQGKVVSVKATQAKIDAGVKAYRDAKSVINKYAGSKKAYYTEKLNKSMVYLTNAKNYIAGWNDAQVIGASYSKINAAGSNLSSVKNELLNFSATLASAESKISKEVSVSATKNILISKYITPLKAVAPLADAYANASKAADAVAAKDLEAAKKFLDAAGTVSESTNLGKAVAAYVTTVKAQYEAAAVPTVVSVSANNLKNITVTFNKEVNKDTVTSSNVKVYDGDTLISGVTLNLLDDNKTLLISNNGSYTQNKAYRVIVENVKQKGTDVTVTKYDSSVKVLDTTLPTVESVNVLSPKTVEIIFSEPVQTGAGAGQFPTSAGVLTNIVQVDGINLYATPDVTKVVTGNKVTLNLNTPLTAGAHKIKVAGVNDFANLPVTAKEFDLNVATDTTAPQATSVVVLNKDKVKVTFTEPVDNATVQSNLANIKVNGTAVSGAVAKDGGTSYELTLGASLNLASVVESTFEYKGIKDNYGNTVTTAQTIMFKAVDDITAPVVTNTVVNSDNSVEVTFSEDVTGFTGTTKVELYDKDNKKVSNVVTVTKKVIDGVASDKVYTLTIANASTLSGSYSLKILKDNVTDQSIRTNKFAETTLPVTLNDKVAPTIAKAEYVNENPTDFNSDADQLDSKLTIYFSEAMDVSTLTNKSNYLIGGTPLSDVSGTVTLTPGADNKSVTITVNRSTGAAQLTFAAATDVRVIAVKDSIGNTLATSQVNHNLGTGDLGLISAFNASPAFTSVVSKVEAISKNQVKLYATTGNTFAGIDANKIKFAENQSATALIPTLQVTSVSVAADGKTAVLTLNNNLSADRQFDGDDAGTTASNVSLYADADAITVASGAKTAAALATGGYVLDDKIAPTLDSVSKAASDTINVTFNETIAVGSLVGLAGDLVVTLADGTVLNPAAGDYHVTDANPADSKFEIVIDKDGVVNQGASVKLTSGRYVADASVAANVANTFDTTASTTATVADKFTELSAPLASVTTTSATGLVLTFNEDLYNNGVAIVDGADVKSLFAYNGTAGNYTSATYDADTKTVTFVITGDDGKTLTVAGTVTDVAGNVVSTSKDVATYTLASTTWALN